MDSAALSSLFIQYLLPPLATLLAAAMGMALRSVAKKFEAEAKDQELARILSKVATLAAAVVQDVEAEVRPTLGHASEDGKLSPEEKAKLKSLALARLIKALGEIGMDEVKRIADPDVLLPGAVERAVAVMPRPPVFTGFAAVPGLERNWKPPE